MISRTTIHGAFPTAKLGDVVEFLDNLRQPVTESERLAGPYPYYGANGQQGTIASFLFDEPLLLLAEDGGHFDNPKRGIAYRIEGKTWVNNHAHVLRAKDGIDLAFLCRVLENYDVTPFVTGTTRGKLTKAGAAEIPVPIPALREQRRIAAILDQADALRAKRREALAQLDRLTQAIFIDMFGDPLKPSSCWKRVPVSDFVAGFESGKSVAADDEDDIRSAYRVLKVSAVTSLSFRASESKAAPPGYVPQPSHVVRAGDLLFSRANTAELIGATAFVFATPENVLLPDKLWRFVWHETPRVTAHFVNYLFRQVEFRAEISRRASGSSGSMKNISQEKVLSILVGLPPISAQQRFSRVVEQIEEIKCRAQAGVEQSENLFTSLQHRAFRGEL